MNVRTPEDNFLAYLGAHQGLVPLLIDRIPIDIFSPEGKERWTARAWESEGTPAIEADALKFLRSQMLAILAREAGRAQKFRHTERCADGLSIWLSNVFDSLQPPPLEAFSTLTPEARECIPTGIERLDEPDQWTSTGRLGVIFMPSGRGKNWCG